MTMEKSPIVFQDYAQERNRKHRTMRLVIGARIALESIYSSEEKTKYINPEQSLMRAWQRAVTGSSTAAAAELRPIVGDRKQPIARVMRAAAIMATAHQTASDKYHTSSRSNNPFLAYTFGQLGVANNLAAILYNIGKNTLTKSKQPKQARRFS